MTTAPTIKAPKGPQAPFARITGRLVLPDGTPATGATLTLDPLPCKVSARLADGPALIGSRVRTTLDEHGRVASKSGKFVDVIGCGEGVSPSGSWAYMVRLTGSGVDWRGVAILRAGTTTDLTDILAGVTAPSGGGDLSAIEDRLGEVETLTTGPVWQPLEPGEDGIPRLGYDLVPLADAYVAATGAVTGAYLDMAELRRRVGAVESGPYRLPGVSLTGEGDEAKDYDLSGALTHIASVFGGLRQMIDGLSAEQASTMIDLMVTGENGALSGVNAILGSLSEQIESLTRRVKALENAA